MSVHIGLQSTRAACIRSSMDYEEKKGSMWPEPGSVIGVDLDGLESFKKKIRREARTWLVLRNAQQADDEGAENYAR